VFPDERLPRQPHPLPPARPRRPLRRLGTTPTPLPGTPNRLPDTTVSPCERSFS
jgi:hypothetical protein